jgi:hypothetical protein
MLQGQARRSGVGLLVCRFDCRQKGQSGTCLHLAVDGLVTDTRNPFTLHRPSILPPSSSGSDRQPRPTKRPSWPTKRKSRPSRRRFRLVLARRLDLASCSPGFSFNLFLFRIYQLDVWDPSSLLLPQQGFPLHCASPTLAAPARPSTIPTRHPRFRRVSMSTPYVESEKSHQTI